MKVLSHIIPQVVFLDINLASESNIACHEKNGCLQDIKNRAIDTMRAGFVPDDEKYKGCFSVLSKPISSKKLKGALLSVMNIQSEKKADEKRIA